MSSRLSRIVSFLAIAALFFSACSATTVVADENRRSSDASTDDAVANTDPAPADDDQDDEANEANEADDDSDPTEDQPQTPRDREEANGFGLGGAEQLAALRSDCEAGKLTACDVLFQLSDFDTEEEAIALSCAGRADATDGFCTEGIVAVDGDLYFDDASDGLAVIIEQCVDGDLTACDFLFFRSGPNSDSEEIGSTCGGRVDVAVPDCRTFLADAE